MTDEHKREMTLCGADCAVCEMKEKCKGCAATCGSPFGGRCVAAEYRKTHALEDYRAYKEKLKARINQLLAAEGIPGTDALYELCGAFVNLEYGMPGGERVKLLNDRDIYLGCQIPLPEQGLCYGVVAGTDFLLVCSYRENGTDPELLLYRKRKSRAEL